MSDEHQVEVFTEIGRLNTLLDSWKNGFRTQKKKLAVNRIEVLADLPYSLADINQLIDCSRMWNKYDLIIKSCAKNIPQELKFVYSIRVGVDQGQFVIGI